MSDERIERVADWLRDEPKRTYVPKRIYVNGSEIRTFRDFRFESDGGYPDRLNDLEDEVARLRAKCNRLQAFAEELWWYQGHTEEWDDAAKRLLHFGDVRSPEEIQADAHKRLDPEPDPEGGK